MARKLAQVSGYTLTLHGTGSIRTNGRLSLASGAFTGTNVVTVDGEMSWSSISIGGSANTVFLITTNGRLNLITVGSKFFYGALANAGRIVWTDPGAFNPYGLLHNLAGGLIDAQSNAVMNASGGSVLINQGTLRKSGGTGNTDIEPLLINTGTLDAQVGAIRCTNQAKTFSTGTRFTGAGTNLLSALTSGQALTLDGVFSSENLVLGSATLAGNGTLNGVMGWSSGSLGAGASLTVASTSLLQRRGSGSTKNLSGTLTNAGQMSWTGGAMNLYGLIHNAAGGLFEARNDVALNYPSGTPVFINDGTFRQTASRGNTTVEVAFVNKGTVDTQTGTIQFLQEAKTFNAGCRFTGAGRATLTGGTVTLNGTIESENLVLAGATLSGAGSVNGSFTWNRGTLTPDVSFNVTPAGQLLLAVRLAPLLSVTRTPANTVVVSWPGPEAGWKLQATTSLSPTPVVWAPLPPPYQSCGTNLCFIEAAPAANKFYRLHKP